MPSNAKSLREGCLTLAVVRAPKATLERSIQSQRSPEKIIASSAVDEDP
jgi:hypothetical protein